MTVTMSLNGQSEEMEGKVLRRIRIAKMSRDLETRLALASFKHKYNMHSLSFDHVEAQVCDAQRPRSLADDARSVVSTESGSTSSSGDSVDIFQQQQHHNHPRTLSSPLDAPHFSDAVRPPPYGGASSGHGGRKRARFGPQYLQSPPASSAQKPLRARSAARAGKRRQPTAPRVPSSPPLHSRGPSYSFAAAAGSSPPGSPSLPSSSLYDDPPLPALYHGSPPRTPPPSKHAGLRKRRSGGGLDAAAAVGEEGADLLLYLATSPTPATRANGAAGRAMYPPSTPPSRNAALPNFSSVTQSGGGGGARELFPAASPLANFNFADFVNVTPSPAQAPFSRTPGGGGAAARTPLAAKEARRKLNFDSLVPPNGSPGVGRAGLGMELEGELAS